MSTVIEKIKIKKKKKILQKKTIKTCLLLSQVCP